jgi:DUF2946 family protein
MRWLKNFLPIVLVALAVQIFAPIGACWAASIVASDPLAGAVICHGSGAPGAGQTDQADHRAHDGCCSFCSVLQGGAPVDVPQVATIDIERVAEQVAWRDFAFRLTNARAGSQTQARAPPAIS